MGERREGRRDGGKEDRRREREKKEEKERKRKSKSEKQREVLNQMTRKGHWPDHDEAKGLMICMRCLKMGSRENAAEWRGETCRAIVHATHMGLASVRTQGPASTGAKEAHESHDTRWTAGVAWCMACGRYGSRT